MSGRDDGNTHVSTMAIDVWVVVLVLIGSYSAVSKDRNASQLTGRIACKIDIR